eukprot:snap_masked-scaffold_6-processed-gene-12.16-mRNA-1 protein AED:1.00 eAED:1.00 QI:0/0/0/0/1/1/2/0/62
MVYTIGHRAQRIKLKNSTQYLQNSSIYSLNGKVKNHGFKIYITFEIPITWMKQFIITAVLEA